MDKYYFGIFVLLYEECNTEKYGSGDDVILFILRRRVAGDQYYGMVSRTDNLVLSVNPFNVGTT